MDLRQENNDYCNGNSESNEASLIIRRGLPGDFVRHMDTVARAFSWDPASMISIQERKRFFVEMYRNDPWFKDSTVLLFEDRRSGTVAACLNIFRRRTKYSGREIRIAGIGLVATHPDYQRQGLASGLLDEAERILVDEGVCFSVIFGSAGIYGRAGWEEVKGDHLAIDLSRENFTVGNVVSLNAGQIAGRSELLAAAGHLCMNSGRYSSAEWSNLAGWLGSGERCMLELSRPGADTFFVRGRKESDVFRILDVMSLAKIDFPEICRELAGRLKLMGCKKLVTPLIGLGHPVFDEFAVDPVLVRCLSKEKNCGFRVKFHNTDNFHDLPDGSDKVDFPVALWQNDHL